MADPSNPWTAPPSARPRRPVAAVVGGQHADAETIAVAETLGAALVDAGFRIVNGGYGGVMAAVSRGARCARSYASGDVVGVLPTLEPDQANPWVDLAIATGMGHARNVSVVGSADVVIAVGGGAGTLSEIAHAWGIGRPVIALDVPGWSRRLGGECLDARRPGDVVEGPFGPVEAAAAARASVERLGFGGAADPSAIVEVLFGPDATGTLAQRVRTLAEACPAGRWGRVGEYVRVEAGGARGWVALVSAEALEIRLPTTEWVMPYQPVATTRQWQRFHWSELDEVGLARVLTEAAEARAAEYADCVHCGESVADEHRIDGACHACASSADGVVF